MPCLARACLDRQGNVLSCLVSPSRSLADTFLNSQPQRGGNKWQQMAADDKWIKVYSDICAVGNKSKCTTHLVLPKFCLLLCRRHFAQTDRQTCRPPHMHMPLYSQHMAFCITSNCRKEHIDDTRHVLSYIANVNGGNNKPFLPDSLSQTHCQGRGIFTKTMVFSQDIYYAFKHLSCQRTPHHILL